MSTLNLRFSIIDRVGGTRIYKVEDGCNEYRVEFNSQSQTYSCQCHLFETHGIICGHAITVYKHEGVDSVPSEYILDRWSKEFRRNHLNARAVAVRVRKRRETYNNLYALLHPLFLDLVDYAALDEGTQESVIDVLNNVRMSFSKSRETMTESVGNNTANNETVESADNMNNANGDVTAQVVNDPIKRRKRGRHPTKRLKSTAEKVLEKTKKKKKKKIEGKLTEEQEQ